MTPSLPVRSEEAVYSPPVTNVSTPRRWFGARMYLRQLAGLGIFFWVTLTNNLRAAILRRMGRAGNDPARWQERIQDMLRYWRYIGRRLDMITVDFPEADQLGHFRGMIVAANHPSLMDAFAILSVLPRAVCIMRSGLRRRSTLSVVTDLAGYIANDRGAALIHAGINRLARGDNLLIFPEGTRSRGGTLNPFKRGFAMIATRTGTPVQTILVKREGVYFSKEWPLFRPAPLPTRLSFRLGECFTPEAGESADAFARRLEAYFRREVSREDGGA